MKDYDNKEIYGDKDKKILSDVFDEYADEILAIHSKYEEPMKIAKELSEKENKLTNLNKKMDEHNENIEVFR